MDFTLNQEHQMVQEMVREFVHREVAPQIKEFDRQGQMAPYVLKRMAELGILGICLPVRYGGQGMDYISLGLVCEELEAVDTTLRVVMSVHVGLNSMALFQWADEEQKQRFLVPQARGEKLRSFRADRVRRGLRRRWTAQHCSEGRRRVRTQRARRCGSPWLPRPTMCCGSPAPTRMPRPS